jgi:hypothetical protein
VVRHFETEQSPKKKEERRKKKEERRRVNARLIDSKAQV